MTKPYNPLYDTKDKIQKEKLEASLIKDANLTRATIAGNIPVLVNLDDRTVYPVFRKE